MNIRRYLASAVLATSLALGSCQPSQQSTIPQGSVEVYKEPKRTAKIYWDAYADEEYRKPTTICKKWKPCLETLLNNVEKKIRPQVITSKRFRKYFDDVDFVITNLGKWKSPDIGNNYFMMFFSPYTSPTYMLNHFKNIKTIKFKEVDLRIAFTGQYLNGVIGMAQDIPGSYLIVRRYYSTTYGDVTQDTMTHELGHLFGLFHNDTPGNQMHHIAIFKDPKFTKQARTLIADRFLSMISARNLEGRIEQNKHWLKSATAFVDKLYKKGLKFSGIKGYRCELDKTIMPGAGNYTISINPSGSLHVEYHFHGAQHQQRIAPHLKKLKGFRDFLKKIGVSEKNEDVLYYQTDWAKNWADALVNVDKKAFDKNFDTIMDYMGKHKLIDPRKARILKELRSTSLAHSFELFDFLYYYARRSG